MNMYIPLSTDVYLPALPTMAVYFGADATLTGLTLSSFMFMYALGMLIWGPVSDKHGRKVVLAVNFVLYILSSIGCAFSATIYMLIAMRALQGIGAGGVTAVSMAIVKDSYSGKRRDRILAVVQSMSGIAPVLAPILGAWILTVTGWRAVFLLLTGFGVICLLLTGLFTDTLSSDQRFHGSLRGALGRLWVVSKNRSLMFPTLVFALATMPFMGYLLVSSFVYVKDFGLSAQEYSLFFAANGVASILGPVLYVKFFVNYDRTRMTYLMLGGNILSGLAVLLFGTRGPIAFLFSFMLFSMVVTALRPFSSSLLLDQHRGDTGSTSAVINTMMTVAGSIGMVIASAPWHDVIRALGLQIAGFSLLALLGWYALQKSPIVLIERSSD